MRFLIPLLFLTSCTTVHVSTGLIDPALGLHLRSDARDLSALHTSIQAEKVWEPGQFRISLGAGPSITTPIDDRSNLYGAEVSSRITYAPSRWFQPFLYQAHGVHYHDSYWLTSKYQDPVEYEGSDTRYEFSTRAGIGIAIQPTERFRIDLSYQWFHVSNGKSVWSDQMRQFFHLPKADTNDGFEGGAIFIGVQYEW